MIKLSVITVTYNAETTLESTLKSVAEQSFRNIEHILVDGASTDGTLDLIKSHTGYNLRWISEPDNGLYDAMNRGIDMAEGEYLCFLNAGDSFFSEKSVEQIFDLPEGSNPDIIYGETAIVDREGKFLYMRQHKAPQKLTADSFKKGMLVCHQAFIVKREIADRYDLSYQFSSDFDWAIRMIKKSDEIFNRELTLINYLNEGVTTQNRWKSLWERYTIMVKQWGHLSTLLHHTLFVARGLIRWIGGIKRVVKRG